MTNRPKIVHRRFKSLGDGLICSYQRCGKLIKRLPYVSKVRGSHEKGRRYYHIGCALKLHIITREQLPVSSKDIGRILGVDLSKVEAIP